MTKKNLFDPKIQQPIPSEDCPEFSVDVFIIDEDEMHGLACYHFEDKKWYFHTDTLVDYNEEGSETEWKWYYPDAKWSEEATEPDYKALYLEGRELLEKISKWELPETGRFWDEERTRPTSYEAEYGSNGVRDYWKNQANQFLTKHKDLTPSGE